MNDTVELKHELFRLNTIQQDGHINAYNTRTDFKGNLRFHTHFLPKFAPKICNLTSPILSTTALSACAADSLHIVVR